MQGMGKAPPVDLEAERKAPPVAGIQVMRAGNREEDPSWLGFARFDLFEGFSMTECGWTDDVLKNCIEDVLSEIKPTEYHDELRHGAIKELSDCISSIQTLKGADVKPYGSFASKIYAISGDLDVSVELWNNSDLQRKTITNMEKVAVLQKVHKALETKGIPTDMHLITGAKAPILQYVSKKFGISCDVSVENYPGLIKSKVFYWLNQLDGRFGDMVLLYPRYFFAAIVSLISGAQSSLCSIMCFISGAQALLCLLLPLQVKEWAKSQDINNPKSRTLSSYSLCLLVIYHFQTCEPVIFPPLKEIYDLNIKDIAAYCEDLDKICEANIAEFQSHNINQRNESSLSHLFATFFQKETEHNILSKSALPLSYLYSK